MRSDLTFSTLEPYLKHSLSERVNIPQTLDWIRDNKDQYKELETAFCDAVTHFNEILLSREVDKSLQNTVRLRKFLRKLNLSNILSRILANPGFSTYDFIQALNEMNVEMSVGESLEEGAKTNLPYLRFHKSVSDPRLILTGAFIHFYDTFMRKELKIIGFQAPRELISDALCEAICDMSAKNLLFDEISNPEKLNWVVGYEGFSLELQERVRRIYSNEL